MTYMFILKCALKLVEEIILVHLVGFIRKKFVTMHGHMNVKKVTDCTAL